MCKYENVCCLLSSFVRRRQGRERERRKEKGAGGNSRVEAMKASSFAYKDFPRREFLPDAMRIEENNERISIREHPVLDVLSPQTQVFPCSFERETLFIREKISSARAAGEKGKMLCEGGKFSFAAKENSVVEISNQERNPNFSFQSLR